jgi:hypothetical protein
MSRHRAHFYLGLIALTLFSSFAGTTHAADDDAFVKAWLAVCQGVSAEFELQGTDEPQQTYRRIEQPVFRHAQPARGNDIGAVWLWVDAAQRPVAIADIFTWSLNNAAERVVSHEFHSLAKTSFQMRFREGIVWKPTGPGLNWMLFPMAPVPAETKPARLRQARELAGRFTANTIDFQQGRWELRVTPQPVYQYPPEGASTPAGALFALCQGTDCELWLVLEIESTTAGPRWHYALAPFTDYAVEARLDGDAILSIPQHEHGHDDRPHWIKSVSERVALPASALPKTTPTQE